MTYKIRIFVCVFLLCYPLQMVNLHTPRGFYGGQTSGVKGQGQNGSNVTSNAATKFNAQPVTNHSVYKPVRAYQPSVKVFIN